MNKELIAVFVFAAAIWLNAYDKTADAIKAGQQKLQAKNFTGAAKDADEALSLAGENANDRIGALFFKGQVAEMSKDYAKAKAEFAKIAADGKASVQQKVMAVNRVAGVLLNENKFDEARAEYAKIAAMNGVTPVDIANARIATAKSYERQMDMEKAARDYSAVFADPAVPKQQRAQAVRGIADIFSGRGKYNEARAEYLKILTLPEPGPKDRADVLTDIARSYEKQSEFKKAREELAKASAVEGLDAKGKAAVLTALSRTFKAEGDLAGMKKSMADVAALVPSPDYSLLRDYALLAASKGDIKEEEGAWTQIMAIPTLNSTQYAEALFRKITLLAESGKSDEAKKLAITAETDPKLGEEQKFLAALLSAGFKAGKDASMDAKTLPVSGIDAEKKARMYEDAAKVFMRAGNHEVARFFGKMSDSMFRDIPHYVYECRFMEQAPFGVSGWNNSEIVKDPSRREARFEEYNKKAAALLINDVNVVRDVGTGEGKKCGVGFCMAADTRGWHVYVNCRDEQADQVLAGLVKGEMLEMYFQPGKGECYYQWMITLPSDKTQFVDWMSPHRHYRKMDDYFKAEVAPVGGGFGVYMFFPWDFVYDKLPKEGDLWTFGLVDWGRDGGFTWGSGQVHELSRFGKVKFTGVDKYMPAIRRFIVMKAFASYGKSAASATTFWNDEVKGDREFYGKVLLPRIERLNELGKLVRAGMNQADADMLFEKAVPDWMEFDYLVCELRTKFVQDKLFAEGK